MDGGARNGRVSGRGGVVVERMAQLCEFAAREDAWPMCGERDAEVACARHGRPDRARPASEFNGDREKQAWRRTKIQLVELYGAQEPGDVQRWDGRRAYVKGRVGQAAEGSGLLGRTRATWAGRC